MNFAAVLAAMLTPWLLAPQARAPAAVQDIGRGAWTLVALAGVVAGLLAVRNAAWSPALAGNATAGFGFAAAALLIWLVPSVKRAAARVGSPVFQASVATLRLPRWYVMAAALTGGVAADALLRAAGHALLEARTGAAWQATGLTLFLDAALHVPRWTAPVALAAGTTAACIVLLMRWYRAAPAR